MIGPSERERMALARAMGRYADSVFRDKCREVWLEPAQTLWPSPLQNLADRRARLADHKGMA